MIENTVKLLLHTLLVLVSTTLVAADIEYHFWPTPIVTADPERSGALFAWPEYSVVLHTKSGTSYVPAEIDDALAGQLSATFAPKEGSPITISRNSETATWGLSIRGGVELHGENAKLLPAMAEKFAACLGALNDNDLSLIKEVIYAPLLFVGPHGGLSLRDEQRAAALSMFTKFQANRCEDKVTTVPELLLDKTRKMLSVLLTGSGGDTSEGAQLVLTSLFHDLLFAPKGLWVRTTLATIQEAVEQLLTDPVLKDRSSLQKDYDSFVDFVLLSKDESGLTKPQYLKIAQATGVSSVGDIFKPFLLKQYLANGTLVVMSVQIGTRQSTMFFRGAKP